MAQRHRQPASPTFCAPAFRHNLPKSAPRSSYGAGDKHHKILLQQSLTCSIQCRHGTGPSGQTAAGPDAGPAPASP